MPHVTVLYLVNRPIAIIPATSFDQAALASCLAGLRMRPAKRAGLVYSNHLSAVTRPMA